MTTFGQDLGATPSDWRTEAARLRDRLPSQVALVTQGVSPGLADAAGYDLVERLYGVEDALTRLAVLGGPGPFAEAAASVEPHLPRAIAATDGGLSEPNAGQVTVGLLHLLVVLRCGGRRDDPGDADRFAIWLARVAGDEFSLEDLTTARRAAVAAVAFQVPDLVQPLWDAARTAAGYAGRRIPPLLAAVVTSEPSRSWEEFRVNFPELLERDDLSWSELVAVARRVYGVPDRFAEHDVLGRLAAEVTG